MNCKRKTKIHLPSYRPTIQPASSAGGPSYLRFAQGLSLVELLTGAAILALVAFMIGSVYVTHFKLFSNQNTSIDVESQNRIALDEMVNQTREAASLLALATIPVAGTINTNCASIVLALWPLDPSTGDPVSPSPTTDSSKYDHIIYYVDSSNNLIKYIQPATTGSKRTTSSKILATRLSQITASCTSSPVNKGLILSYIDNTGATASMTADANGFIPAPAQINIELKIGQQNYDKRRTFTSDQIGKAVLRNK